MTNAFGVYRKLAFAVVLLISIFSFGKTRQMVSFSCSCGYADLGADESGFRPIGKVGITYLAGTSTDTIFKELGQRCKKRFVDSNVVPLKCEPVRRSAPPVSSGARGNVPNYEAADEQAYWQMERRACPSIWTKERGCVPTKERIEPLPGDATMEERDRQAYEQLERNSCIGSWSRARGCRGPL